MLLPSNIQLPQETNQQSSTASWQLLTGHSGGDAQLWAAPQNQPMHPLAVLKAATPSPVRSLLLIEHQLLCCAHADGLLVFYGVPSRSSVTTVGQDQGKQGLPCLKLQHAMHQAHRTGLEQCAMSSNGLLTLGCSGTILMWSKQQIAYFAEQVTGKPHKRYGISNHVQCKNTKQTSACIYLPACTCLCIIMQG